jgi:hypothetical protein
VTGVNGLLPGGDYLAIPEAAAECIDCGSPLHGSAWDRCEECREVYEAEPVERRDDSDWREARRA